MDDTADTFQDMLRQRTSLSIVPSLCAWSDLLGFGGVFAESNWNPGQEGWDRLAQRVDHAYRTHLSCLSHSEYILCLNDAVVRTLTFNDPRDVHLVRGALWLRCVAVSHARLNESDREGGHPGVRTIVSAGNRANYAFGEVRRENLASDSNPAHEIRNPNDCDVVVSNPIPLQLNTAFSKAYFLDSLGSAGGLGGPGFFLDQTVLWLLCEMSSIPPAHAVPMVLLGLKIEEEVDIDTPRLKTTVYRVADSSLPRDFSTATDGGAARPKMGSS